MNNIDLKELNLSLTPEKIVELMKGLGVEEYIDKKDYFIFPTCCHHEDANEGSKKLYYYKKDHRFVCYTDCGCSFNIFTLFERRYKLLGIEYNFYKDIVLKIANGNKIKKKDTGFYSIYESKYDKYKIDKPEINLEVLNPSLLNIYTFAATPEWLNDGISEEVMRLYNIRYCIEQNKIIIPHYDVDNNLIGIRGRALNEEDIAIGKYMPVQIEGRIYSHPLMYNVYGLNIVKDNIKKHRMAIIAESEKSPMQYATMFGKDKNICTACCGSALHSYQVELLTKAGAEKILVAFDKEGKTWEERDKYFNKLKSICERYKNKCKMGFIYDSQNLLELKESPFDKGSEIFKNLMKKGVWI